MGDGGVIVQIMNAAGGPVAVSDASWQCLVIHTEATEGFYPDRNMFRGVSEMMPDIAGRNIANPTSLIRSAAMMLSWLGERRGVQKLMGAGSAIADAVDAVPDLPANRIRDLGGTMNTDDFGRLVAKAVAQEVAPA